MASIEREERTAAEPTNPPVETREPDRPSAAKQEKKKKKKKKPKRWSWTKPKDKPKRPLSAYNLFFQITRARIVAGLSGEGTEEEIAASIEAILSTASILGTKKKKRSRNSHGKIGFGNLASVVSERWKNTGEERLNLYRRYAELDKKRYYSELAVWEAKKKEAEALSAAPVVIGDIDGDDDSKPSSSLTTTTTTNLDAVSETSRSSRSNDGQRSFREEPRRRDPAFHEITTDGGHGDIDDAFGEIKPGSCRDLPIRVSGDALRTAERTILVLAAATFDDVETESAELEREYRALAFRHRQLAREIRSLEAAGRETIDIVSDNRRDSGGGASEEDGFRRRCYDHHRDRHRTVPRSGTSFSAAEPVREIRSLEAAGRATIDAVSENHRGSGGGGSEEGRFRRRCYDHHRDWHRTVPRSGTSFAAAEPVRWHSPDDAIDLDPAPLHEIHDSSKWFIP